MSDEGVCGNPTVFAPKGTFDQWTEDEALDDPDGFAGISRRGQGAILVFHDPEATHVFARDGGALFVQVICSEGIAKVKKHLDALPAKGWKKAKGTYPSDGGEHVLFDGMLFEEESGKPVRVKLAKGDYALDELGIWKPDDETELAVVRLVPAKR